jgi:hypothetical protein
MQGSQKWLCASYLSREKLNHLKLITRSKGPWMHIKSHIMSESGE